MTQIIATAVSKGSRGSALPETSLEVSSGQAVLAAVETEQRPTVLALIVSGRMRPSTGTVTLDGSPNRRELRNRVAIVDAPHVSEPHVDVSFGGVVAEELMFAGRMPASWAVRNWLEAHDMRAYERVPMGELKPEVRIRALAELALLREGVDTIVLVSPDRHGGDPMEWWRVAGELAARGIAVLVIAGFASAALIEADTVLAAAPTEDAADLAPNATPATGPEGATR